MEKNYYHIQTKNSDNISFECPSTKDAQFEQLSGGHILVHYASGDEMLQISHNGVTDIYASFPINAEEY